MVAKKRAVLVPTFPVCCIERWTEKMEEELEGTEPRLQVLYIHDSNIVDTNDHMWGESVKM